MTTERVTAMEAEAAEDLAFRAFVSLLGSHDERIVLAAARAIYVERFAAYVGTLGR